MRATGAALPPHRSDAHARCAVGRAAGISRSAAAACWLGRRVPRGPPVDASPVRASSRRHRRPNYPRAPRRHTFARDRPVVPNQSATPGHCGRGLNTRHPRPHACDHRRRRACGADGVIPGVGTSLLRFSGPFSVRWPRRVLVPTGRPARRTNPASALPRDTRAFPDDGPVSRNSPLRVCAILSSDCEVEVLGVADERGWAFRPDRKPTPEEVPGASFR